jgi:hypothetical protein
MEDSLGVSGLARLSSPNDEASPGVNGTADGNLFLRLHPFSDDARPAIRGKSPLELAGSDISQLPMAALYKGLSLDWPLELTQNDVPNR